jgi:hypothetical protein
MKNRTENRMETPMKAGVAAVGAFKNRLGASLGRTDEL